MHQTTHKPGIIVACSTWQEYELLDCGDHRKLERFGPVTVVRGEPKAWWKPANPNAWHQAAARHDEDAHWTFKAQAPREWPMQWHGLTFLARFSQTSKHLGVFPEQAPHWEWMRQQAQALPNGPKRLLNLFGYTGAASLVAAQAGFEVTHVDASQPALTWARRNQELSGLQAKPIRWILDDAFKYVRREIRRGKKYDALVLDPPAFGRGPRGEVWKVENQLAELLDLCRQTLSEQPRFVILTSYNIEASALMLQNLVEDVFRFPGGQTQAGELALPQKNSPRVLPLSIFARWPANAH